MAGGTGDGGAASSAGPSSTLTSGMSVSGLSNHLRLSEGLSCLDYHPSFRALAIGSTRQVHVVEVIAIVGHDVAAAVRQHRQRQQQQQQANTYAVTPPDSERAHASLGTAASSDLPASPPPPVGPAPFLMRNTGVFGGLNKVESVAWYPSTEEASLAFIQPARTVTIFLDAIQFKADGTYLPQQWTRSQYKGKTLTSAMAAGGGSTAMAVVANLDCVSGGITPAASTTSLGGSSGLYTPASASLVSSPSYSAASASQGSAPHETSFSTPTSSGFSTTGFAARNLPHAVRNLKGPLAKELIELNIDITYMRVEKIVWDPHHPYTLALSSPATHFEVWQVPTDGWRVYAPQLVLRPPAHNTRSVVRDIAFSPSNPDLIVVVTECGNTGQVLLYSRRQVEAKRCFDISGPGLSVAFHPIFSDLLAVCFRREKTKPDTRISFLQVMPVGGAAAAWLSGVATAAATAVPATSSEPEGSSLAASSALASAATAPESADASFMTKMVPASTSSYLVEQPYLPHIDNYVCISRIRWRPSSMGRLTEPKRHHYMSFTPSAQALLAACNLPNSTVPSAPGAFTWVDLLHSQLWFASAAMTTDTDLSIWDATNGFFPVCVVKHLAPRGDTTTNESNDFAWLNELTLVTIFKSGDVVCTSLLNSLPEDSVMTSAERVQLRAVKQQQQQQLHRLRQQLDSKSRDELGEPYSKRIAEGEACLAMLPAYVRDPYADLLTTFTVLPTTSIVSDLFGHSYTIRNTNAALRRHYHQMIRRECGQLIRRLAIQVSKEAVLRQQWTSRRHQLPGITPSTGPSMSSGLAALQEQRSRRPRSPFTQTGGLRGRATSSQDSNSTPPSPQCRMLTRRCSVANPSSSTGWRQMPVAAIWGDGTAADAIGLPQHPQWSLEDVSEAGMVSPQHSREPRRHASNAGAGGGVSSASPHPYLGVHHDGGMEGQSVRDVEASGHVSSPYPEVTHVEEEAAAATERISCSSSRTSSAVAWIKRLLDSSWREQFSRNRSSEPRDQCIFHSPGRSQVEDTALVINAGDDRPAVLARVLDVTPSLSIVPSSDDVAVASPPPLRLRQLPPCGAACGSGTYGSSSLGPAQSTATSPISVIPIDNNRSSCGSPHQLAPTALAAQVHAAAAHSFPAYPGASTSANASVSSACSPQQQRVGSGRGGPSPSSLLLTSSSLGALPSVPGDLDSVGGGSGVVFTQLFPLLNECVRVCSGGGSGGSCKARGKCNRSEEPRVSRFSPSAAKTSAPVASVAPLSVAPASLDNSLTLAAASAVRHDLPTVLFFSASCPASAERKPETATTSPPLLPLSIPAPVRSRLCGGTVVPTRSANAASQLMPAHAYLASQRVVTVAVESFVLSDAVCGWSYPEKQAEQLAFVRFALEWDMGYELALAMKALRHKRTDAEAAAQALAAADDTAPHRADPMPTAQPRGPARSQTSSREAAAHDPHTSSALPRSLWRSSSSSVGGRQDVEWRPQQRQTTEPYCPQLGGIYSGVAAGRERRCVGNSSARGPPRVRSGAPSAGPTHMVDWGYGVPVPSHEDVDDKVAAMMEENARICERMMGQRWEAGCAGSASGGAHTNRRPSQGGDGSGVDVSGSPAWSSGDAATTLNDAEGVEVGHADAALAAELSNAAACDPRAQWWRAAAHAWRSHHVSFIISITAQQLEYASLMGDVQYSLVLYILFCLWWRLHSEVAEATYAMALEARARRHHVGSGVSRDSSAGARDRHRAAAPQESSPRSNAGPSHRLHAAALAPGIAVEGEGGGRGGLGASEAAADPFLSTAAPPLRSPSMDDDDVGAGRTRIGLHCVSDVTDSDNGEDATDGKIPPLEEVDELRQLCLFFLRCPLMPLSPNLTSHHLRKQLHPHLRPSASVDTLSSVKGGSTEPGDRAGNASSPVGGFSSIATLAGGGGAPRLTGGSDMVGNLGRGGWLRASASSSLPSRSHNNSSQRLNDTPQALHRSDNNANGSRAVVRQGAAAGGITPESRNAYADLEGVSGAWMNARNAEDLCATPDYCAPEEWKIRALQWLETYTADLYARQLYVPLNELLLVMPEIFREPTNPVLPRAADIAYEKQMTYVYCGTCSKAELWSRAQQDAVPAAVRLYELVARRGRHTSSSEEEGDDSNSNSGVSSAKTAISAGMRRSRRKGHGEHQHASAAIRCGSEAHYYRDGGDSSSVATTPSVESPTSSSPSVAADDDGPGARLADGRPASPFCSGVGLPSEHSTNERAASAVDPLHEATPLEKVVIGREPRLDGSSSRASTTGRSHLNAGAAGESAAACPAALLVQCPQSAFASSSRLLPRGQHNRRITRLRSRHSRRSLDDVVDGAPDAERDGGNADEGEESHFAGAGVGMARRPERRTAVGCDGRDANPTANNAACRRCHNRCAMTCVICEEVVEGMFFWLRSCGHGGHVHHMEEWLRYSQECPKCGVPITQTWKGN
ncbi:conserved hypothetical protein [Leishmania major strain Friedlin]|uniref:Uncharacterized protein n=1 Tax=Leishmania major TaxID=5664 RepID=Q4QCT8_LEIMA|nr:conserved hypothetical protein [Leishmania major strain Friedlin]CAG9573179.1 WD40_repeat-containing_protein [Leishmania major strain Friedlin]CAJ04108.1 conserved hypothetical protein [Leishmania major strain Friedlin]|eukprot:XP_001682860.1 conserved hypothetical protein [Leishmania major strain Friedlin]